MKEIYQILIAKVKLFLKNSKNSFKLLKWIFVSKFIVCTSWKTGFPLEKSLRGAYGIKYFRTLSKLDQKGQKTFFKTYIYTDVSVHGRDLTIFVIEKAFVSSCRAINNRCRLNSHWRRQVTWNFILNQGLNRLSKVQTRSSNIYIFSLHLTHILCFESPSSQQMSVQFSHPGRSLLFLWQVIKDRKIETHGSAYNRATWRHSPSPLRSPEMPMDEESV